MGQGCTRWRFYNPLATPPQRLLVPSLGGPRQVRAPGRWAVSLRIAGGQRSEPSSDSATMSRSPPPTLAAASKVSPKQAGSATSESPAADEGHPAGRRLGVSARASGRGREVPATSALPAGERVIQQGASAPLLRLGCHRSRCAFHVERSKRWPSMRVTLGIRVQMPPPGSDTPGLEGAATGISGRRLTRGGTLALRSRGGWAAGYPSRPLLLRPDAPANRGKRTVVLIPKTAAVCGSRRVSRGTPARQRAVGLYAWDEGSAASTRMLGTPTTRCR